MGNIYVHTFSYFCHVDLFSSDDNKLFVLNCLIWESNQGPLDPDASSLPTVPQSSYKRLVLDTLIYLVASLVPADHCGFWYLSWIYGFYEDTVQGILNISVFKLF